MVPLAIGELAMVISLLARGPNPRIGTQRSSPENHSASFRKDFPVSATIRREQNFVDGR
jgi:hypothetical protein